MHAIQIYHGCEEICFWAARVGKQKKRNPLQDGTLLGGIGQVNSVESNILGSMYVLDLWISEKMDVLDVFSHIRFTFKEFFSLEKG